MGGDVVYDILALGGVGRGIHWICADMTREMRCND